MGFWEKAGKKAKEAAIVAAGTTLEAGSMIKKAQVICTIKLPKT